jgi:polynucleotide 5'-hydroxyl-kinase GRC3/NOL9
MQAKMSHDWADKIARQLLGQGIVQTGACLILGAADTGKTTLAAALGRQLAQSRPIGIVDADIGQSHIGPPTTVGWVVIENPQTDFSQLTPGGISFVGDITPVGHLLQLTAAIAQCVGQVSKVTELIIVDTPGFVRGSAAAALWWTVQRILKPKLILAVQQNDELSDILAGLQHPGCGLEVIKSPAQIPVKSPQNRRSYRQSRFGKYFRDPRLYNVSLSDVAVQASRNLSCESLLGRLVALRDEKGVDVAIGVINSWQDDKDIAVIRAPQLEIQQIRCLVIGDATVDMPGGPG